MTRRELGGLALAAIAGAQTPAASNDVIKPRTLAKGDTVGLITPSTFVSDPEKLETAERTVRYFGLVPKWGKYVGSKWGYAGGTIEQRLEDLHAMFADPSVKGIFCIRGGYAAGQLLDKVDYKLIQANPKVFVGYSDITALHLAIRKMTGLVTFHGPVPLSGFTPFTQEFYRRALFDSKPLGDLTNPPESNQLRPNHHLHTIRPGKARGRLVGGNLTLVATTMGTPYEVDTRGKIFFIEDVDEAPYSIDRMLTQLRLAGKFQQAAGVVWGECADCRAKDYKPSFSDGSFTTSEVALNILGKLDLPVLSGLTIGHTDDQLTLPEGVMAELDATGQKLTILESATV